MWKERLIDCDATAKSGEDFTVAGEAERLRLTARIADLSDPSAVLTQFSRFGLDGRLALAAERKPVELVLSHLRIGAADRVRKSADCLDQA